MGIRRPHSWSLNTSVRAGSVVGRDADRPFDAGRVRCDWGAIASPSPRRSEMFLARCDRIGRDAIIWASDLIGVHNTGDGIVLSYRCVCGETAEMLTGASSAVHLTVHTGV